MQATKDEMEDEGLVPTATLLLCLSPLYHSVSSTRLNGSASQKPRVEQRTQGEPPGPNHEGLENETGEEKEEE